MKIQYIVMVFCISSTLIGSKPIGHQKNVNQLQHFRGVLDKINDTKNKLQRTKLPIEQTEQIFELYHLNEVIKEQYDHMHVFGLLDKPQLAQLHGIIEDFDTAINAHKKQMARGLGMVRSLSLLDAKKRRLS